MKNIHRIGAAQFYTKIWEFPVCNEVRNVRGSVSGAPGREEQAHISPQVTRHHCKALDRNKIVKRSRLFLSLVWLFLSFIVPLCSFQSFTTSAQRLNDGPRRLHFVLVLFPAVGRHVSRRHDCRRLGTCVSDFSSKHFEMTL